MKNCETEWAIHEITGHKINCGPVKRFPILGPEVPAQSNGFQTQITLVEDIDEDGGTIAEMANPQTVVLYNIYSGVRGSVPICRLEGRQINTNSFTRRRLRYAKRKVSHFYIEAAQQPDSTL